MIRFSSSGVEQMEDEGLDSDVDGDMADSDAEGEDSDADEDLAMEMEDGRAKADEMGVEHLATLERLRQNQRQDYLKVGRCCFVSLFSCRSNVDVSLFCFCAAVVIWLSIVFFCFKTNENNCLSL